MRFICLSSRHYPTISVPNCPEIVVDTRNKSDIITYIRDRFSFVPPSEAGVVAGLECSITEKAAGVFLWLVTVVDYLLRDIDRGQPVGKLTERLRQVPKTMEELYTERCLSISAEERAFSLSLIQWVLFREGNPELDVDSVVLAARLSLPDGRTPANLECFFRDGTYVRPPWERTARLVNDASRGLIECTAGCEIQFIHETAREFFFSGPGFGLLDSKLAENPKGLSYMALVDGCLSIINALFNDYYTNAKAHASACIMDYARHVERHDGTNIALLDSIRAGRYCGLEPGESILRFVSRQHLISCVLALLNQGVQPDEAGDGDHFTTPLAAAFHDHSFTSSPRPDKALVAALIQHGANIECTDCYGRSVLLVAVSRGWPDLAEFLAESGADVNFADRLNSILELLMFKAGAYCLDDDRPTPEQWNGLLSVLLARGADPNLSSSPKKIIVLHRAVRSCLTADTVRLLVQAGPDVNAVGAWKTSVLHVAAERSAVRSDGPLVMEMLEVLMKGGCSATNWAMRDSRGCTALDIAQKVNPEMGREMDELVTRYGDRASDQNDRTASENQ